MIPASFFKAFLSGGVPGLSSIVFIRLYRFTFSRGDIGKVRFKDSYCRARETRRPPFSATHAKDWGRPREAKPREGDSPRNLRGKRPTRDQEEGPRAKKRRGPKGQEEGDQRPRKEGAQGPTSLLVTLGRA